MRGVRVKGSTSLELALLLPIFCLTLFYSLLLTELGWARLKLQEAARFSAWAFSVQPLSDYARARHAEAFTEAADRVKAAVQRRYADLDSGADRQRLGAWLWGEDLRVQLSSAPVTLQAKALRLAGAPASVMRFAKLGLDGMLAAWRFDRNGKIHVELGMQLQGGAKWSAVTQRFALKEVFLLVVSDWHLREGGDHRLDSRQHILGIHQGQPGGYFRQVARMTFSGAEGLVPEAVTPLLPASLRSVFSAPQVRGPFVVSHNYRHEVSPRSGCAGKHPVKGGLRNLDEGRGADNLLDQINLPVPQDNDYLRCFDTSPFRDTARYSDALSLQLFDARGPFAQGCRLPQTDEGSCP